MMKYLLSLMFIFFLVKKSKLNYFCFNLVFMMSLMMISVKSWNYGMSMMMSLGFSVDYYSYNLIIMSFWVIALMYMISSKYIESVLFLLMLIILFIFFMLKNLLMFYLFFEISLIPIFIMLIYLGYNLERLSAAYYMLMYTLMISLPLLIYIMQLYEISGSWDFMIMEMKKIDVSFWSFMILIGAFLVKMPMYFFHIWLPKAHVEAPVYGSMMLAAILLKLGSYGLLRMLMIFFSSGLKFSGLFFSVGLVGSLLVSMLCLVQIDMKSLVAYSSVVHMNMMLCCLMSFMKMGYISSYIIMISHGLCSSGMFYMVNLFYMRSSSRLLMLNKGYINLVPSLVMVWFLLCMSNFSFPLSIGFFGEIYLIGTLIKWEVIIMIYLVMVSFVSSAYSLYLYLYVSHGETMILNKFNSGSLKELIISIMHFFPLMILMINMSLF